MTGTEKRNGQEESSRRTVDTCLAMVAVLLLVAGLVVAGLVWFLVATWLTRPVLHLV